MPQGKVKWFSNDKGFGFIVQDSGADLFVHHSEVENGQVKEGDSVEFEVGQGKKGPCAVKVKIL